MKILLNVMIIVVAILAINVVNGNNIRTLMTLPLRIVSPGYSTCGRCSTPWNYCASHSVYYGYYDDGNMTMNGMSQAYGHGVFALCEKCWSKTTTKEKLKYHRQVTDERIKKGWQKKEKAEKEWELIKKAILKTTK